MTDQTRNLNPTPEAKFAMIVWGREYAHDFRGGSMDFWDQLSEPRKRKCRLIVQAVNEARAAYEAAKKDTP